MSNPILNAMATEYESGAHRSNAEAMRAALEWLADNVSDEMCKAAARQYFDALGDEEIPARILVEFGGVISAALRQAAGGEG